MAKLLINKVILAWKYILRDKLAIATYATSAFLWVGIKAQLEPTFYNSIGRDFLMYHLRDTLCDQSLDPASSKSLWEAAITSYNEMYSKWPRVNNDIIPRSIMQHIHTTASASIASATPFS
jgi:hypothetical protein